MGSLPERPVFWVAECGYTWVDVIAAAHSWGEWEAIEQAATDGLAAIAATGGDVPSQGVEAAEIEFRYARGLLSADETEAWLDRWGLEFEEWADWLLRATARRSRAHRPLAANGDLPDPARAAEVEAICSGALERLAERLASRAAVHAALAGEAPAPGQTDRMDTMFARFRKDLLTPDALEREVGRHALEWTRLDCVVLEAPDEDVMREAALCVRFDGRLLDEVAADAQLPVVERTVWLDAAPEAVAAHLPGARAGDLIGPVRVDGSWTLALVLRRIEPSLDDHEVCRRAERSLVRRAVEAEVARRVRWAQEAAP